VIVRPATKRDLDAVLDLWVALQVNGQAADPRYAPTKDARRIFKGWVEEQLLVHEPFVRLWVAELPVAAGVPPANRVVGMLGGLPMQVVPVLEQGRVARIGEIWVEPEHRRSGVGRKLVEAWCEGARSAGYSWLEVGTLVKDERAVAFWRAMGFDDMRVTLVHKDSR
jgi:ribosomal protein S18 acetylase RimI-like enzyme